MSSDASSENLVAELSSLLAVKERLLRDSLNQGTMLRRDDPEFLQAFQRVEEVVAKFDDSESRNLARRILGHIRQFNPFNTSDVEENEVVGEVVEDFLSFCAQQIEKVKRVL